MEKDKRRKALYSVDNQTMFSCSADTTNCSLRPKKYFFSGVIIMKYKTVAQHIVYIRFILEAEEYDRLA